MKWTCPHCNMLQTVTNAKTHVIFGFLGEDRATMFDNRGYALQTIQCSACDEFTFEVNLGWPGRAEPYGVGKYRVVRASEETLFAGRIHPSPKGKPQPSYIPQVIVADYQEACLIKELSPKASATLARRAVQGIIRDFAGIRETTLAKEIAELRKRIEDRAAPAEFTPDILDAIDGIRRIGNIGAHMEKDINLIVEVEPEEAELLIQLIEDLFDLLYVSREQRRQRLCLLEQRALQKDEQRKPAKDTSAL